MSTIMGSRVQVAEEDASFSFAMQLATAYVLPQALKAVVELDLLEIMKKKGRDAFVSPAELAAELPTKNPEVQNIIDRILRLLASYNIVNCKVNTLPNGIIERLYSLTPVCEFYTLNDDGVSLAPLLIVNLEKIFLEVRSQKDAILEGGNVFNKIHNMNPFEYTATDPMLRKALNTAMSNSSTILMKKVVETYEGFKGLKTLVDVGGGTGASLRMILSKHPTIKGINFDLPHVIREAPSYVGMENIGGDMFVNVPKGDAIFMKWILHDWSDTLCIKILKRCHEALPDNGKVIVVESILPEDPSEGQICYFQLDVGMLAFNMEAKERTEKDFQALAKQAGFKESHTATRFLTLSILEFNK